jgi:flavin reductase (DIM6/NTAB) family NADH-FMN oxidoreductase RutF
LAGGEPNQDTLNYRHAMGLFATGVAVLAVRGADSQVVGMTANAITSVSLDPLLLLVCVEKVANITAALLVAPTFSLNVLGDQQAALSDYFAGRWEGDPPPFVFEAWGGYPLLSGSLAALGCRRFAVLEGGDHWIIEGEVVALKRQEALADPLMFFASRYQRLVPR